MKEQNTKTWLSGYLSMVKTWVDKILDNEHYEVDKNKIIGLIDEWILWLEENQVKDNENEGYHFSYT